MIVLPSKRNNHRVAKGKKLKSETTLLEDDFIISSKPRFWRVAREIRNRLQRETQVIDDQISFSYEI